MSPLALSPTGTELLDDLAADPAAVARSLANIARANRWFGGLAAVRHGLSRLLRARAGPVTLLDVGTGLGDVPAMARRWAQARGVTLRVIGLERHPVAAQLAAGTGLPIVRSCGGELPFRDRGVDIVVISQVAHHFAPASCVRLFGEASRVARLGVVVADLRRSRTAAVGFWLGSRVLGFDPVTRVDGITSLRRGFTRLELAGLIAQAGAEAQVESRPGARLVATWRTGP